MVRKVLVEVEGFTEQVPCWPWFFAISKTADLRFSIFYILVEILPRFFFWMFMMFPTFDHLMLRG